MERGRSHIDEEEIQGHGARWSALDPVVRGKILDLDGSEEEGAEDSEELL